MLVIFDWDGTLCDSADHISSAMQAAARELGQAVPASAEVREIIGLSLPVAVTRLFGDLPEAENDALCQAYASHFVAQGADIRLFDGALATLDALLQRGFELAVATGKSRRGLDRVLSSMELQDYFHATRCADETSSKPDPLMLTELLSERGLGVHQAIMVGDTEYDLEMAANAGMASIGVSFGVHSVTRLNQHGPIAVIDRLEELLALEQLQDLQAGFA
jgi:phosphoglycolate phosphatase